ncbi:MAG: hypothetical protein ACH37Z_01765 [Anaerolineae bacterium]
MSRLAPAVLALAVALGTASFQPAAAQVEDSGGVRMMPDASSDSAATVLPQLPPPYDRDLEAGSPGTIDLSGTDAPLLQMDGQPATEGITAEPSTDNAVADGSIATRFDASISPATNEDLYYFDGSAGDLADINMVALSGSLDPYLRLYDPYGRLLSENNSAYAGTFDARLRLYLPSSGRYGLVARSYRNATVGTYRLTVTRSWPDAYPTDAYTLSRSGSRVNNVYRGDQIRLVVQVRNITNAPRWVSVRFSKPSSIYCDPVPCVDVLGSGGFWISPGYSTVFLDLPVRSLSNVAGTVTWRADVTSGDWTFWKSFTLAIR